MKDHQSSTDLSENESPTAPASGEGFFNPLPCSICLELPMRITTFSAWHEHTPFAMWLVATLRPRLIVELGTHYGDSYCAFCQAVRELKLETCCFAIDTWAGDPHAGGYGPEVLADLRAFHDPLYASFSHLLQSTFADALQHFSDASIDLLHIDGYHTYEVVREDFTAWLPKMRRGGVVLFHDTNVRERDFGVWRLWEEVKANHPHFEFSHGHGLGMLVVGEATAPELRALCAASADEATLIRDLFFALGQRVSLVAEGIRKEQALKTAAERERQQAQLLHEQAAQLQQREQEREHLAAQVGDLVQARQSLLARYEAQAQALELQTSVRHEAEELARQAWQNIEQLNGRLAEKEQELRQLNQQLWEQEQSLQALGAEAHEVEQGIRELLLMDEEQTRKAPALWAAWTAEQPVAKTGPKSRRVEKVGAPWPSPNGSGADVHRAEPEPLCGALDMPAEGESISTRFLVCGWALSVYQIARVAVFLDGDLIGEVKYGSPRPDAAAAFPQYGLTNCGYDGQVTISADRMDSTPHTLLVQITDAQGRTIEFMRSVLTQGSPYDVWISKNEPDEAALTEQRRQAAQIFYRPLMSIITPVYNTPPDVLRAMLDSVLAQTYDHWQLCLADGGSTDPAVRAVLEEYARRDERIQPKFLTQNLGISGNSNEALQLACGEFIALLDHDDEIAPNALYENVLLLNRYPDADMIYSDEDKLDIYGNRWGPFFKPDWSPDLFRSMMYTCHLGVYRTSLIKELGGFRSEFDGAQDYDLVLRLTECTTRIHHIPRVLYHWRVIAGSAAGDPDAKPYAFAAQIKAISEHCQRLGWDCTVEPGNFRGHNRVRHHLAAPPRVSIIIPTRDQADILRRCIESIRARSTYTNYEIIVVDNGSTEPETLDYLRLLAAQADTRILPFPSEFNFSAINNYAAAQAEGELLLLLNNDTEVLSPDWLEAMVGPALREEVGAVGARLLYPDGTLQHGGVILGGPLVALHAHKGLPAESHGYYGLAKVTRNVSAVTGACLMTRRALFHHLGGLDEDRLAVAYNDLDYCLRLREQGHLIVWTPHAELLHHESFSRGYDTSGEKVERLRGERAYVEKRWGHVLSRDPYYNPNLTLEAEDFSLVTVSRDELLTLVR
jgi:O-antigen biosynthesis protein